MHFLGTLKKILSVLVLLLIVLILIFIVAGHVRGLYGEKIGVIEIEGIIKDSKEVISEIQRFKEDSGIKGLIVRIDSPGGATGPTQEIQSEIKKIREKKKVYISLGSLGTSGAYYIASAGDKIYANPSTITGSIGVIMNYMDMEDLLKKIGVRAGSIKSGDFKDIGSPVRRMKEEEKRYLEGIIREIHDTFVKDVAQGRRMEVEKIKRIADGRIFTGMKATEMGLVDEIGTFYDALEDLKKVLQIKGKPLLVYGKKPFSLIRFLLSDLEDSATYESFENMKYLFLSK